MLVGEATRRASEAAIAYADAGEHELKGKERARAALAGAARRRAAARRGARRRARGAVRRPCGRAATREGAVPRERRRGARAARLVVGVAGIGKSRLSWEFEKYIDGLAADVWWHRGRCLSYGDGVAYWALAEMVRGRAKILEDEDAESAVAKLRGDRSSSTSPTRRSATGSSRGCCTCSASPSGPRPTARISSRPGAASSSGSPSRGRW